MSGVISALFGSAGGFLDTQTVTTGTLGTAGNQDRQRGFRSGVIGSIVDGTSNIFGGAAITEAYWDEPTTSYYLTITGATNTGWTNLSINGVNFTRASAAFAGSTWSWTAPGSNVGTQAYGGAGATIPLTFT